MDRAEFKRQAAAVVRANRRPVLLASFFLLLLTAVFSFLSARLTLPSSEQLMRIGDLASSGKTAEALRLINNFEPGFKESLMSEILSCLLIIVNFGFLLLLMGAVRGREVSPLMLLDGFGSWAKVLILELLVRTIVNLGFLLLFVPGIIASYNYRMSSYLLLTHPDYGVLDCMRESRQRMRGHRLALFTLDLSFLGWAILASLPLLGIPAAVYASPYWKCSCLLFFESLCRQEGELPPQEPPFPF